MHFKSHKRLTLGITSALALALMVPQVAIADLNDLQEQQQNEQGRLDDAREKEKAAKEKKEAYQQQINVNATEIEKLSAQIDEKEGEIARLQTEIYKKGQQIERTQRELEEAEQRVKERDKLLKDRLRLMYEQGEVRYLEVLLGSTSFSDFLERFSALQMIFEQDTVILKKNKEDRELIAQKKKQMEEEKTTLVGMQSTQLEQKTQLDGLKAQKEEIAVQLESNKAEQERIESEQRSIQESSINAIYALQQQISEERKRQATQNQGGNGNGNGGGNGAPVLSGPFAWPVPSGGWVSSEWGNRIDPFTGQRAGHNGLDIAAAQGTDVAAAQGGIVITAGWVSGFGNCIIIDHGGDLWTLYGHLMNGGVLVSVGQEVGAGQIIGKVGSTGRSTGPHLHFGVYQNGIDINPYTYL
ncbi:peptidase M23-like protein [Tumebacillus sp. BK434]|uniref:murein hydrolase activator EnvC family protein n=1 Tax=Tumebacillus sp. BK434 TaxID=2512169 RepID=UPI0010477A5A|nr:peptidoglycan DD-metalloendopeptidase family protein [Tumebacillus sp. BK434]TCP55904.1 peptidase M23-like protein [Tumebacillus sp. BK434]